MIVVGFWKILGVYFFNTCDFCILGLTTVQLLCCRIFKKSNIFQNPTTIIRTSGPHQNIR